MTRILHVADTHFGMVTHSRPDPKTGLPSRLLDVARCWDAAVDIALDREVDAVIVAGDVFHSPSPDAASLNLFAKGLRELQRVKTPTLLIAGNHDRAPHPNQRSVLELFRWSAVHVATEPKVVELGDIRVACLPSVSRHQLMALYPELSRSEADERLVELLVRIVGELRSFQPHVLTGHWPVQGAILGNEKDIAIVPEPVIPLAELEGPWSYVALGHIHKRQTLVAGETVVAYSGSIDRMNFGEEHEDKAAVEVDLDTKTIQPYKLPARRFMALNFHDQGDEGWDVEGAIVRVQDVPAEEAPQLAKLLYAGGAHVVRIETRVNHVIAPRSERLTEALGPMDALEEFLAVRDVAEEDRPALRDLAKQLMEETR